MTKFDKFQQELKRFYVFNVKYKDKSLFMKFLATILFFNKDFMKNYITTIGSTIYFPDEKFVKENEYSAMKVLAHEIVHVNQAEKYGNFLFSTLYLFPQCLSVLSLLAILAVFWLPFLWCLLFLIFLAPIPAPWRAKFEFEAYIMSLFITHTQMKFGGFPDDKIEIELAGESILIEKKQFKESGYWFMWPFSLEKDFGKKIDDISNGVIVDTSKMYDRIERAYLKAVSAYGS